MSTNGVTCRYGTLCIRENPGCLFIATNRDALGHMTDLQVWPGIFLCLGLSIFNNNTEHSGRFSVL